MAVQKPLVVDNGSIQNLGSADSLLVGSGIDSTSASAFEIGTTNATSIDIGASSVPVEITGDVTVNGARVAEAAGYVWEQSRILTDANWTSITYTGSRFVAVSNGGGSYAAYSDNGTTWIPVTAIASNWATVAAGGNTVVAVNPAGNVMRSTDGGLTWTYVGYVNLPGLNPSIGAASSSSFVSVSSGARYSSNGGLSFTASANSAGSWADIIYANGRYLAVGGSGSMYSTDLGVSFTQVALPEPNSYTAVAHGAGVWVAVSQDGTNRVARSTDNGITWTAHAAAEQNAWVDVSYGNGAFVAVSSDGTNRFMRSTDGITWTAYAAPANDAYTCLEYGASDNIFVAMSALGDDESKIATSTTGTSWTEGTVQENSNWETVGYGDGNFVALSSSGAQEVAVSQDGITWLARTAAADSNWRGVAYGNGLWIAVGNTGTDRAMISSDAQTWSTSPISSNPWEDIAFGKGRFVAVAPDGGTRITYTDDGVTWIPVSSYTYNSRAVAYGQDYFYALGVRSGYNIIRSLDGVTWTAVLPTFSSGTLNSIAYGNGTFVVVGTNGSVLSSTNGTIWTEQTAAENNNWERVTFGAGLFVAVSSNGTNRVMTSKDGVTWTSRSLLENSWYSVAYGNGLFVAVAGNGVNRAARSGVQLTVLNGAQSTFLDGLNVYQGLNVLTGDVEIAGSLDTGSTTTLEIGTTNANAITIGQAGVTTTFPGPVDLQGAVTTVSGTVFEGEATFNGAVTFGNGDPSDTVSFNAATKVATHMTMDGTLVRGLGAPVDANDATRKTYVDGQIAALTYSNVGAPATDGTDATGTWGIDITGNSATSALAASVTGGTAGKVLYQSGANATAFTAAGTSGQLLQSNGTSAPSWVDQSAVSAGSATTATNLAGGSAGSVPYQSGSGNTTFLAPGAGNQVLLSNGTSLSWSDQSALSVGSAATAGTASTVTGFTRSTGTLAIGASSVTFGGNFTTGTGTISFGNAGFTWPSANANGLLLNDASGNLSWKAENTLSVASAATAANATTVDGFSRSTGTLTIGANNVTANGAVSFGAGGFTSGSGAVTFDAGDITFAGVDLTFPTVNGTSGQFLQTNGAGTLTWADAGGSGVSIGDTVTGATATYALYVDGSGNLANSWGFKYDDTDGNLLLGSAFIDPPKIFTPSITVGPGNGGNSTNTAFGVDALSSCTPGTASIGKYNVALGYQALSGNTTGYQNVGIGQEAGRFGTTDNEAIYIGYWSSNFSGGSVSRSISIGAFSGVYGNNAVAVGRSARAWPFAATFGDNASATTNCTALGYNTNAGDSGTARTNSTAIGYLAAVNADNQIRLGNSSITSFVCQVALTVASDERDKADIEDVPESLPIIESLRPVTYRWDRRDQYEEGQRDGSKKDPKQTVGFLAQDLQTVQTQHAASWLDSVVELGEEQLGITPDKLIPVLVKAVQELSAKNKELETRLAALEG